MNTSIHISTQVVPLQSHFVTPLHIAGNTTSDQRDLLKELLTEAMRRVYRTSLKHLDRQGIALVLDMDEKLKSEIAASAVKIIQRLTVSDKFKDEEAVSQREYSPTYHTKPVEAQVTELRKTFPELGNCLEKLARRPLPESAEAWFAIPRWQAVAPTYGEAVELVLAAIAKKRKISNRVLDKLGPKHLRQNERSRMAEQILTDQQQGSDILMIPAQFGHRLRGCSARRARVVMAANEYGLGSFSIGCMLLTHPERLAHIETLMIDCTGDEYSLHGDKVYDRVPLYDYDIGGIEFSVFYEDRARNLWGTPTGFTIHIAHERKDATLTSAVHRKE